MSYPPAFKTSRKLLIDAKFAVDHSSWPKADSGKACIFEAICIVGSAKFGADWTGKELQALDWPVQPQQAHDHAQSRARLNSGRGAPGSRLPSTQEQNNRILQQIDKAPNAHVRDYRAMQLRTLVHTEQVAWVENQQARHRLSAAVEWLAQRCRDGELVAYARPSMVGALYPMAAWEWNAENPMQRYVIEGTCQRYFPEVRQTWSAYVFFDRAAVEAATATLTHAPAIVTTLDLQRLSPYLRLAVNLALAKGYTSRENPDTQAVREAEVKAAWGQAMPDVPQSQKAIEAIVKVIGFPNSAAILQGKAKRSRKTAGSSNH